MRSTKSRVILGSVLLIAAPVSLLLVRYLQVNPISSLFTLDTLGILGTTAILSVLCSFFVFIAGMLIPFAFAPGSDSDQLDYSSWAIFGGVLLAMFIMLCVSFPWSDTPDPRNEDIEIRSLVLYMDPDGGIHDHPYCVDSLDCVDYVPVPVKGLINNELYEDFEICEKCNWAYYDKQNDVIHYFDDCVGIPEENREDVRMIDSIFGYAEYSLDNLCPYCY